MAKQIRQFRYYEAGNSNNQPSDITKETLVSGTFIGKDISSITQLGIQTLPGTRFYLNNATNDSPIIIGSTGIYELDIEGISSISEIHFDSKSIDLIETNESAYLIIDMICE